MGCRAQGDCLPFPEGGHSRGEGKVSGTWCPTPRAVSRLSVQEVAGFSCLVSATIQGSEQGQGLGVKHESSV